MLVASEASSSRRAHDRRRLELVPRSREVIGGMNTVSVRRFTRFVIISVPLIMFASPPGARAQGADRPKNSVTFFAATLTGNNWEDFLAPTDIKLRDTYLAGLGYARRITSFFNKLDVEALGQTAVHLGHAHQWEFDAALVGVGRIFRGMTGSGRVWPSGWVHLTRRRRRPRRWPSMVRASNGSVFGSRN